jgi:hypothetical protein
MATIPTSFGMKKGFHYASFNKEDKSMGVETYRKYIQSPNCFQKLQTRNCFQKVTIPKTLTRNHHVGNRIIICLVHLGFHNLYYI